MFNELGSLMSNVALALFQALSILVTSLYLARHANLAPTSEADAKILARFKDDAALAKFHEAQRATMEQSCERALSLYQHTLEYELARLDPRTAATIRAQWQAGLNHAERTGAAPEATDLLFQWAFKERHGAKAAPPVQ